LAQQDNDFSKGSVLGHIIRLAVPMTMAQVINVLYNIVDRIYIGRIQENATQALTGMGVCFPIITLIIAFANLIGTGGAPLFSIERGKGDREEADYILGNSATMLIIFGVSLTVFFLLVKRPLLFLLGASEQTFPYANEYLSVYLMGSLFVMLSLGLNSFINAQGFGVIGMLTVAIGAVLNVILDPIFIFTWNMGVKGAALATVISQFAATIWTVRFLTGKKTIHRIEKRCMRVQAARVKKIVTLGLSGFTMAVTNSAVQMVCNASLQTYGGDIYVGTMTVINSVREVVELPVRAIMSSVQPVMSFNYGAKAYGRVKEAIRDIACIEMLFTCVMWAILSLFPEFFIRIFNQDAALIQAAVPAMHIYFFGFFMMTFQYAGQSTFTSLGKSKYAVFFSIFRKGIVVIPLTLLLPGVFGFGVNGIFLAEPISNFVGGIACFATMYFTVYRKLDIWEKEKKVSSNI